MSREFGSMTDKEKIEAIRAHVAKRIRRPSRGPGSGYKVLVRSPGEERGHAIKEYITLSEAGEFIRDMADRYEEGTLLYIVLGARGPAGWGGGLKETYMVNEEGMAIRRSGRGWIPSGVEYIDIQEFPIEELPSLEEAIRALKRGYVYKEDLEESE
jgi:hypothetical protein